MKIPIFVYVVVDANGEERSAVAGDPSDGICVGAYDAAGKYQQFESEAYHLQSWVDEHGFTVRRQTVTVEA